MIYTFTGAFQAPFLGVYLTLGVSNSLMTIGEDIHWHDSLILSIRITPEKDLIEMCLLYPEEWRSNSYTERTVIFENAYGYKEFEGPLEGSPTIFVRCRCGKA